MVRRSQWHVLLRWVIVLRMCGVINVMHVSLFQSLLNLSPNQRKDIIQANQKETGTVERLAPATLKEFSLEYFRYLYYILLVFTSWSAGKCSMEQYWQQENPIFFTWFYRQPTKDVNRQVISRNVAPERLWANSREPIRQPLLKKLLGNSELSHKACLAFTDILYTRVMWKSNISYYVFLFCV